ncbi:MAG: response regulator transcription factor [Armatimonadetes bacterium]|nr:response regulator transcription factor [Armatimonadota bacterium]
MTKILVVDDESPIVDAISYNLRREGYEVGTAADADECLERVGQEPPDLVILDVMLPSGSGLDICRRLRSDTRGLPVLLLTARAAEADRLRGFEAGADDYVVKPFSMRELMARVQALLRRRDVPPQNAAGEGRRALDGEYPLGNQRLMVNPDRREVIKDGTPISLSRKEFDLLSFLAANRGRVFDRQTLLSRVWGEDCYVDDRTVDVHIRWLREKLEATPGRPEMLLTVRGVGYKFQG